MLLRQTRVARWEAGGNEPGILRAARWLRAVRAATR
jgi:hypothetical protein